MALASDTPLLVGVDGGATEVKAHAVVEVAGGFAVGTARAGFRHEPVPGFAPADLARQIDEFERGAVRCTALEEAQAAGWIDSFAAAIASVAARVGCAHVVVGVCAPGLKSRDGRSIIAAKNGPRVLAFVDRLEARLAREGLVLARPIPPLLGDGLACGLGEDVSPDGGFRSVQSAYFAGGGTGVAECFKLDGRVRAMDGLADASRKAWQLESSLGKRYEEHLSVRGLNARFRELGGPPDVLPEIAAAGGDQAALRVFAECADMLGELARLRIEEVRVAHGIALERIVVGQRLAQLYSHPALCEVFRARAEAAVPIPIHASTLRAAPAIGAAHAALTGPRKETEHAG
ncbi:MAG: hypothetical protein JNL28_14715 [Planctomycetes bacterium]|nr:hypothetical protein [Planctomycetota bacterium]